jgi:hypothetical protein
VSIRNVLSESVRARGRLNRIGRDGSAALTTGACPTGSRNKIEAMYDSKNRGFVAIRKIEVIDFPGG